MVPAINRIVDTDGYVVGSGRGRSNRVLTTAARVADTVIQAPGWFAILVGPRRRHIDLLRNSG